MILAKSIAVDGADAEDDAFELEKLLDRLELSLSETVYLNWSWFPSGDVDEIKTEDVLTKFTDIWYPAADDLDLIDPQMQWVLSIHHWGAVSAWKSQKHSHHTAPRLYRKHPSLEKIVEDLAPYEEMADILGIPVHLLTRESVEAMSNSFRRTSILADARVIFEEHI